MTEIELTNNQYSFYKVYLYTNMVRLNPTIIAFEGNIKEINYNENISISKIDNNLFELLKSSNEICDMISNLEIEEDCLDCIYIKIIKYNPKVSLVKRMVDMGAILS